MTQFQPQASLPTGAAAVTLELPESSVLAALWQSLQNQLEASVGSADYAAWLASLKVAGGKDGQLILTTPTVFIAQWVESHYLPQLEALLTEAAQAPVTIQLQVAPHFSNAPAVAPTVAPATVTTLMAEIAEPTAPLPDWLTGTRLDNRYTFAQFVTGKSNQFAAAAAQGVANAAQIGQVAYNPFFLHGGVGLGKTHLMHAIGLAVLQAKPGANILYLSAEQFMYKFIRALKDKSTIAFKDLFRNVDILMVDDIQFIAGKDSTQEEFFHTFNTLVQQGKQIILTADRSPHELANIEDRLKSRLGSGLTVEVHAPEEETRLAILQAKAESLNFTVPPTVLQLLATHIASNVRELEGALNRLVAYARLTGEDLTPDLAREQLRDLFRVYTRTITIDDIQQKVATQFNIRVSDMHSPRRAREVARPRQVAMYLAKQLTNRSYPDIGRAFGGRDHTTVIHACETITGLLPRDSQLAENVDLVTRTLQGR